jgi:hypothetical protein
MTYPSATLNDSPLEEFLLIARHAGQDSTALLNPEPTISYFRIENMADSRRILSRATHEERKKRSETFLDGLEYRSRIGQGMHDRGEAHAFANHVEEAERDFGGHRSHFPIFVRTMSVREKTVPPGEAWDITVTPREWGVDEREELYNIVNLGRLILKENASVAVRGNALTFTCQELICEGNSAQEYDIGVLGTSHGFGYRRGAFDGERGADGKDGSRGKDGVSPQFGNNFLGKTIPPFFDPASMDGKPGGEGDPGSDGAAGLNGGACRIAEINIRAIRSTRPIFVGAISGNGGNGGDGGDGGNGGDGADGVGAVRTIDGIVGPGTGGKGGSGGKGGNGGRAGHGGISSNVFVNVEAVSVHLIRLFARAGRPGQPGKGGRAGTFGKGGHWGAPLSDLPGGQLRRAGDGVRGSEGRDGRPGRCMPAAKMYLNSEWRRHCPEIGRSHAGHEGMI